MNHLSEFNNSWGSHKFITIELEPLDINKVLQKYYNFTSQFTMTKSQLWDMEIKKASRPDLFIPSVIKSGSAASWGRKTVGNIDTFVRVSKQRLWLKNDVYGIVIENVHVDHKSQLVTFVGESTTLSNEHSTYSTTDKQPLFHVQHGVIGEEPPPDEHMENCVLNDR